MTTYVHIDGFEKDDLDGRYECKIKCTLKIVATPINTTIKTTTKLSTSKLTTTTTLTITTKTTMKTTTVPRETVLQSSSIKVTNEDEKVDECEECHPDAECLKLLQSYDCYCKAGFKGNGYACAAEFEGDSILYNFQSRANHI